MTCGLNTIEPGTCSQPARLDDPLCALHAALAAARAFNQRKEAAKVEQKLQAAGCVVPEVRR